MKHEFTKATLAFYNILDEINWFSNVGIYMRSEFYRITSWRHALLILKSIESENALTESGNEISRRVPDEIFQDTWNETVEVIKEKFYGKLNQSIKNIGLEIKENISSEQLKEIKDVIQWDILNYVLLCEYGEYVKKKGIYDLKKRIYIAGHYPCGWIGDYPEGQLAVF